MEIKGLELNYLGFKILWGWGLIFRGAHDSNEFKKGDKNNN